MGAGAWRAIASPPVHPDGLAEVRPQCAPVCGRKRIHPAGAGCTRTGGSNGNRRRAVSETLATRPRHGVRAAGRRPLSLAVGRGGMSALAFTAIEHRDDAVAVTI